MISELGFRTPASHQSDSVRSMPVRCPQLAALSGCPPYGRAFLLVPNQSIASANSLQPFPIALSPAQADPMIATSSGAEAAFVGKEKTKGDKTPTAALPPRSNPPASIFVIMPATRRRLARWCAFNLGRSSLFTGKSISTTKTLARSFASISAKLFRLPLVISRSSSSPIVASRITFNSSSSSIN